MKGCVVVKTLVLVGSRNDRGQTATAAAAFGEGLRESGATVETVFLPCLNIERCRQCDDDGWGMCKKEGRCIIEDDLEDILSKGSEADLLVFATPVYFSDTSESLRAFLDRLRRMLRFSGRDDIRGKKAVGICVAGGGGGGAPECAGHLDLMLRGCGFDVLDMVPVRRQNLEIKVRTLRTAGAWFGSSG